MTFVRRGAVDIHFGYRPFGAILLIAEDALADELALDLWRLKQDVHNKGIINK